MSCYALVLEYNGDNYCGWQKQEHSLSVQGHLEKALSKIANEKISTVCAGRTDTGVHASAQVVNFSTHVTRNKKSWILGANSLLPQDIRVFNLYQVNESFSARFSALHRRYQYLIHNSTIASPLFSKNAIWFRNKLHLDNMNEACRYLLGEQNFSSFRSSKCQSRTAMRYIHHAYFLKYGEFVLFDIRGNAFLHHMVRNIVGVMLEIGVQRHKPQWIKELLDLKDRKKADKTSPAGGLYLVEVSYPKSYGVYASRPLQSFLL